MRFLMLLTAVALLSGVFVSAAERPVDPTFLYRRLPDAAFQEADVTTHKGAPSPSPPLKHQVLSQAAASKPCRFKSQMSRPADCRRSSSPLFQVCAHILPLVLRRLSLLLPRKRSHSISPAFRSTSCVGTRKLESD